MQQHACADAVRWPKRVTVAVNLSPAQFKSRNLLPAIVSAVVGLSSSLGITTTAEGVETREQLASLTSEDGNEFRRFLFSEPKPIEDILRLLGERTPRVEAAVA